MRKKGNKRFKKLLVDLGFTNRSFSKKSGVSEWYISTAINGLHVLPSKHRAPIVKTLNEMLPPWDAVTEESLFGEEV
jgi:hypothetical protein